MEEGEEEEEETIHLGIDANGFERLDHRRLRRMSTGSRREEGTVLIRSNAQGVQPA